MQALERTVGATAWLGSIGALAAVALLLIAGSLVTRVRRLLADDAAATAQPRDKGAAALEMIASLAAAVGLLGTFLALRQDGGRLVPLFAPALAGQVVFVFCQGALGLFRSWNEAPTASPLPHPLPPERTGPLPPPFSQAIGGDPWPADTVRPGDGLPGAPPPRRPRRPAVPPLRISRADAFAQAALLVGCMFGSILLHAVVFFVALRAQAGSAPKEPERAGVFAASIVPSSREPAPVFEEPKKEEPKPPPPEPPKPEIPEPPPPPPEPPKAPVTEQPKAEVAEKPKPEPPTEAAAPPEPPPKKAEVKEDLSSVAKDTKAKEEVAKAESPKAESPKAEAPKPAAAPQSAEAKDLRAKAEPPTRLTESSEPTPAPTTAEPAAGPAPKAGAETPVLGFGEPPKNPEKSEAPSGSDPRGTASDISTLKDYRKFLAREMKAGRADGAYVPHLRFGDNSAQENREINRYFGMELIAYPKNQKFYVYISPEQDLYSKSNDFTYIQNFSSRAIFRSSAYFDGLRAEAAKRVGVSPESLVVAQLLKPASATYISWKESETARRAGVALDAVEACDATFVKTPFGVWIVRIDRLVMKDGRKLAVEDFEWTRVARPTGGDR